MPAFTLATTSSSHTSHLSGHLHGDQPSVFRFGILICAATAIVVVLCLLQYFSLPWFLGRHPHHNSRGSLRTGSFASKLRHNFRPLADNSWRVSGQGPDRLEKQASWAISRGEASGTAPVGLGGSVEGRSPGSMEAQETTTPTEEWSRGVSTFSDSEITQESSGLSHLGRVFPAAAAGEQSQDVRIPPASNPLSPPGHAAGTVAGSAKKEKDSMDSGYPGGLSRPGSAIFGSRSVTPFFGPPEDIAEGTLGSVQAIGGGSSCRRRFELNLRRPYSPPPLTPHQISYETQRPPATYVQPVPTSLGAVVAGITRLADGQGLNPDYTTVGTHPDPASNGSTLLYPPLSSVPRRMGSTRGLFVPPTTTPGGIEVYQEAEGRLIDASRGAQFDPGHTSIPSSYPSTSPLLPPPPPTMDHDFDLAEIMFPGAGAVDGGLRVVHAGHIHGQSEGESNDVHGDAIGVPDDSGTGWKRHTRVYDGGVCLACAAAGGGGFYGARVRPEDKR